MGKSKALAHHTSTYFHTRRVSIQLSCFRSSTLAGAPILLSYAIRWELFFFTLENQEEKESRSALARLINSM